MYYCDKFNKKGSKMIKTIFYVAVGGAVGSVLRYITSIFVAKYWVNSFPLATFLTNILGCFLIGLIIGLLEKNNLTNSDLKWLLITGFCGGFTTFSTFAYENSQLFQNQNAGIAFIYTATSILVGLASVWLGLFMTKL